jgi:uncharacterized coiled-coil protein SlyX
MADTIINNEQTRFNDSMRLAEILGEIKSDIRNLNDTVKGYKTSMDDMDQRLRKVENTVEALRVSKQEQIPKTPWYNVVGAVVGIITAISILMTLLTIANNQGQ